MAYIIQDLQGLNGRLANTNHYEIPMTPAMAAGVQAIVKVVAVSAGVTNLNPATLELQQSWDRGATWVTVAGTISQKDDNILVTTIYGAGVYIIYPTPASKRISPVLRLAIIVPAGETITTSQISRLSTTGQDAGSVITIPDLTITANAGATSLNIDGAVEQVTVDSLTPANNIGLPITIMQDQGKGVLTPIDSTATQVSVANVNTVAVGAVMMGWDTANLKHKELSIDPFGNMAVTADMKVTYGPSGSQFSNPVNYCTDDRTQNVAVPTIALIAQGEYPVSGLAITNASVESNDIKATATYGIVMGFNGTIHKELGLGAQGSIKTVPVFENTPQSNLQDFTSNSLTDTPETILTLTASVHSIDINDTSGYHINLYVDGVLAFVIPPGGCTYEVSPTLFDSGSVLTIAAQTGVTITSGAITVTTFSAWSSF